MYQTAVSELTHESYRQARSSLDTDSAAVPDRLAKELEKDTKIGVICLRSLGRYRSTAQIDFYDNKLIEIFSSDQRGKCLETKSDEVQAEPPPIGAQVGRHMTSSVWPTYDKTTNTPPDPPLKKKTNLPCKSRTWHRSWNA